MKGAKKKTKQDENRHKFLRIIFLSELSHQLPNVVDQIYSKLPNDAYYTR